ncbi:MFS transporter [Kineosporia sp. A_224]|uniref:MFS transporter n=1 Tax=Kineosporia sp. A_224 TaxID=1962180 RepID=UPI000B4B7473|nr:MFS transporter [Kineosporia sp. A_224]
MTAPGRTGSTNPYLDVLRVPGAAAFCAAATLARLPMAMISLGALLLVSTSGRSFTLAGLVSGATALGQAAGSPPLGRLVDRLGQTRVLGPQALVNATLLGTLVVATRVGAAGSVLVAVAALVGATAPQVGALARARWGRLLDGDPRLETALALEAVIEEGIFVTGPLLVAGCVALLGPPGALLAAAGTTVVGSALFLAQRSTEPAPHPPRADGAAHPSALRSPGLVVLVAAFTAMGACFGFVEVGVVALADDAGRPGAAGLVLGLWTLGSLVSGVVYGARAWTTAPARRLALSAVALAAGALAVAVAGATTSGTTALVAVTAALVVAGAANAPTIITGNALVPDVVPATATTEAYTWLNVTIFAGAAVGAAAGGAVADRSGAAGSLAWATVAAALTAVVAVVGRGRLVRRT